MKQVLLAIALSIYLHGGAQAAMTITATAPGTDVGATIGATLEPITVGGWDLTGTGYLSLTSIDQTSVTMTIFDGDSALGDFDYDDLVLVLDNIDTGLKLNGFSSGQFTTLTISGANSAGAVLTALQADGKPKGSIIGS